MGLFSGFFNGFGEGVASAIDDIRHNVVEIPMYGRETTGNIELPQQVQAPPIEPPSTSTIDLASPNSDPSWGIAPATVIDSPDYSMAATASGQVIEPPVEPVSWQQTTQGIESPQIEAPAPSQDMER